MKISSTVLFLPSSTFRPCSVCEEAMKNLRIFYWLNARQDLLFPSFFHYYHSNESSVTVSYQGRALRFETGYGKRTIAVFLQPKGPSRWVFPLPGLRRTPYHSVAQKQSRCCMWFQFFWKMTSSWDEQLLNYCDHWMEFCLGSICSPWNLSSFFGLQRCCCVWAANFCLYVLLWRCSCSILANEPLCFPPKAVGHREPLAGFAAREALQRFRWSCCRLQVFFSASSSASGCSTHSTIRCLFWKQSQRKGCFLAAVTDSGET